MRYLLDEGFQVAKPGAEPKWQKLFPLGATKYREDFPGGKIAFTPQWCAQLVRNAKALIAKTGHRIQVNFHHIGGATLNESAPLESTVAAGWMLDVELRDDGPYALTKWTDRAREFIEKEELLYISPEFALDYQNRDTGKAQGPTLLGAALTNTPFLKELPAVAASETGAATMTDNPKCAECGANMACPKCDKKEKQMGDNAEVVKLNEQISLKDKHISETEAKLAEATKKLDEAKAKDEAVVKMAEQNKALADRLATLEAEKQKGEIKLFFDEAVKAGRCTPAMREGLEAIAMKSGIESVRFVEKLAPVVMMGEVGVSGAQDVADPKKAATARLDAKVTELQSKGLTFREAFDQAKTLLRDDFTAAFSA